MATSPLAHARNMVTALESALSTGGAVVSIDVDGTRAQYDRRQALDELRYWRRRVLSLSGKRPRVAQVNLS